MGIFAPIDPFGLIARSYPEEPAALLKQVPEAEPVRSPDSFLQEPGRTWLDVLELYTGRDLPRQPLAVRDRLFLQEQYRGEVDAALREAYQAAFSKAALLFFPGLTNFPPGLGFFDPLSTFFGRGGLVVSLASSPHDVHQRSLHAMIGEDRRVVQNWRLEVPLAIHRLYAALKEKSLGLSDAEKIIFLGHSKGGLVVHALMTLLLRYDAESQTFPKSVYQAFPGLDQIPVDIIEEVLSELVSKALFVTIGSPVEGVGLPRSVALFDRLLLKKVVRQTLSPAKISEYYESVGYGPEIIDYNAHTQMAKNLWRAWKGLPRRGKLWSDILSFSVHALLQGVSHAMGARKGDALVMSSAHHQLLDGAYNHVAQVEWGNAAFEFLKIFLELSRQDRISQRQKDFARRLEHRHPPSTDPFVKVDVDEVSSSVTAEVPTPLVEEKGEVAEASLINEMDSSPSLLGTCFFAGTPAFSMAPVFSAAFL